MGKGGGTGVEEAREYNRHVPFCDLSEPRLIEMFKPMNAANAAGEGKHGADNPRISKGSLDYESRANRR